LFPLSLFARSLWLQLLIWSSPGPLFIFGLLFGRCQHEKFNEDVARLRAADNNNESEGSEPRKFTAAAASLPKERERREWQGTDAGWPEAQKEKTNKLITHAPREEAKSGERRDRAIVVAAGISRVATN